jgi:hypothetical protein
MANLQPTIDSNFYGFDYYEVAYTSLATQVPVVGNFKFPNLTFANDPTYIKTLSSLQLANSATPTTIDQLFSQDIASKDVITIKDVRANNIITNNIIPSKRIITTFKYTMNIFLILPQALDHP